ncbi:MAG: hypothetical protein KF794_14115 [Xanthobacteraceae bacterium]|nr:hypothetical protein [Xanthobacteraceae bacterium]QYK44870.1 MAG: hypothetical protein KF794_14115 [Xanthobacteraceae bacterium]
MSIENSNTASQSTRNKSWRQQQTPTISAMPIGKRRILARYVAAGCLFGLEMPRSDSTSPMMGIFGIGPKETSQPARKRATKKKSGTRKRKPNLAKRQTMAKRAKKRKAKAKAKKKTKKRRKKKKAM